MDNLPGFCIGDLEIKTPIFQGGMGVGVSGKNLASAVANEGGVGLIASVGLGVLKGYSGSYSEANANALRDEIRGAREKSDGIIGVNVMHALTDFEQQIRVCDEERVDFIVSGAGIPRDLPKHLDNKNTRLVPIVSSARYATLIIRAWEKLGHRPDAIVIEGPLAGGHLGFKHEELVNGTTQSLEQITDEVLDIVGDKIPVVVAGGIYTGADIYKALQRGASGVQMGTRFVTTAECDAARAFKEEYLRATKDDIVLIKSPVGLPGRAISNDFLKRIAGGERIKISCGYGCLKTCKPGESPYCIANALVEANRGEFTRGYAFAGANAWRATPETCLDSDGNFIPVKTLVGRLKAEYAAAAKK